MKPKPTVYLLSLGCSKNTVDSEIMLTLLQQAEFSRTDDPEKATHIIVNTCGFIDEAKEEAVDTILELSRVKESSSLQPRLIVTGCLAQGYAEELHREIPEIDAVMGNGDLRFIAEAARSGFSGILQQSRHHAEQYHDYPLRGILLASPGSAYLKISEGCSSGCSFCLIPSLRGPLRSRKIEDILHEAQVLEEQGVRELIITSQDTLQYGVDVYGRPSLDRLLESLLKHTGLPWVRLLYLKPHSRIIDLLPLFGEPRLLPYFDVPVQHAAVEVLRSMGRSGTTGEYLKLFERIREDVPGAVLRTTVMVGFPGEGEPEFECLAAFVRKVRFNHLGVFTFSPQEGTPAFYLDGVPSGPTAQSRRSSIMQMQQEISRDLLSREKGRVFDVLIEEDTGDGSQCVGRSYHFAPDVDGVFVVNKCVHPAPGGLIQARVSSTGEYDLFGEEVQAGGAQL